LEQGPEPPKYIPAPPASSKTPGLFRKKSFGALSTKDSNVFAGSAATDNLAGLITPNKSKDKSVDGKASAKKRLRRKLSLRRASRKDVNADSDNEVNEEEITTESKSAAVISEPFPDEPSLLSDNMDSKMEFTGDEKKNDCSESELSEVDFGSAKCVTEQGSEEEEPKDARIFSTLPPSPKQTIGGNTDPASKHLFSIDSILSDDTKFDIMYKVVIVGNSGVGKSSVMGRWTHNHFTVGLPSTIHVELSAKTFKCMDYVVKVQFWDTAGQERFNSITKNYYRGAHGAVIVYDITQRGTFEAIPRWLKELREANPDAQVLLIGNKDDVERFREVQTEEGVNFAREHGISFLETSALKGTNCAYAMQVILQDLHRAQEEKALALAATSPPTSSSRPRVGSGTIKLTLDDTSHANSADEEGTDSDANTDGCAC